MLAGLRVTPRREQTNDQIGETSERGEGGPKVRAGVIQHPEGATEGAVEPRGGRNAAGVGVAHEFDELGRPIDRHRHARAQNAPSPAPEQRRHDAAQDEVAQCTQRYRDAPPRLESHEDGELHGQDQRAAQYHFE